MFRTLYSKLAAVLLALFALVGAGAILGTLHFLNMYNQEANQRLNLNLAAHLAEQSVLTGMDQANPGRLRSLFDMQMVINPAIHIYLLDSRGRIEAHSAPDGEVKLGQVALGPVQALLGGSEKLPILGEDPRAPGQRRIFSVTPIPPTGPVQGYLYVVLANQTAEGLSGLLGQSYVIRIFAVVVLVSILLAAVVGLLVFAMITRKLSDLADGMERFQAGDFTQRPQLPAPPGGMAADEIDRLTLAFREMAARIVGQVQKLKQTDVLRRELVANVSHDLKTPLASLQGYVDTLLLKDDVLGPEERRNYLSVASRSCERLGKLVADLIELAKLDAHEVTPQAEPFSPGELLQDVAQKFALKASQRRVRLETDLPERIPYVSADIGLIERVLDNLIGNALAHTGAGGTVRLVLRQEGDEVVLQIGDTGSGIADQDLPHIFERFYRANTDGWEQGGHAGLGLAITKSILDLHGSPMQVDSTVGVGTTFAFRLPVVQLHAAQTGSYREANEAYPERLRQRS
jgi:two-component system, OmpR family, sensor kinase